MVVVCVTLYFVFLAELLKLNSCDEICMNFGEIFWVIHIMFFVVNYSDLQRFLGSLMQF